MQKFVDEGASVFLVGRRKKELNDAVAQLGKSAIAIAADVFRSDDVDRVITTITEKASKLDIVFANAAIAQGAALGEIT